MRSINQLLQELDGYLHKNDYSGAEQYLLARLEEAQDPTIELPVRNELMGLYRKCGRKEEAITMAEAAMKLLYTHGLEQQVGAATTFLNSATVYKAFGMAEKSLPLFQKAQAIYERALPPHDRRLAGLYNNMALTLVDLKEFSQANALYEKAITTLRQTRGNDPEIAVTYLNMATAAEAELGLEAAEARIEEYLEQARRLLDGHPQQDGNYAFVCEKCASVFGYYGWFLFKNELEERARRIYGQ
ncbi:MAG: tetratricopeptide repeat protein [Clostridia bacterium]|nr:tetratricopeptide repeat protein [Clostridia bacterium]